MTVTDVLDRNGVIAYVGQRAPSYNLDPAAVLAVANHEGLNTTPGSSWKLQGEGNISFGPPSWYGNGAGGDILAQHGAAAPGWAWTPAGLDYWLQKVAEAGAGGLSGVAAIRQIVTGFERPRADLVGGEIANATKDYGSLQTMIASLIGSVPSVTPTTAVDGAPGVAATDPAAGGQAGATGAPGASGGTKAATLGGMPLNVPSGLVLALLGGLLLVLGALLFGNQIKLAAPVGGQA